MTTRASAWMENAPGWLVQVVNSRAKWNGIDWSRTSKEEPTPLDARTPVDSIETAEALSSEHQTMPDSHVIMLDLDCPAALIPSSTLGHSHLYIARTMPWDQYVKLMRVLVEVGVLEQGFLDASLRRKATFLRLPWIKKGKEKESISKLTLDDLEAYLDERPVGQGDVTVPASSPDPWAPKPF